MIVAEILLTSGSFYGPGNTHVVQFDELAAAKAEFDRISAIFERKGNRENDLPKTIHSIGTGCEVSIPLEQVTSVGLVDFATANAERTGMMDTFPNLFKR